MSPVIEVFEPRLFDGAIADEILASVQERVAEKGRCTIALAGGSTPAGVYRAMSKPPRVQEVDWSTVDLLWGDDRWVPHDDDQSNYRMVNETLLSQLKGTRPAVYPVDTALQSPEMGAKAYSDTIQKLSGAPSPKLDIVLLGIGEDGHTASLFPGSPVLHRKDSICFSVTHPTNGTQRVTMGSEALFSAWRVFFIVKGEAKAEIMRRVLEGSEPVEVLPSRLYTTATGQVTFFLDSGAAKLLSV
jgi:6-phosphogluconolactonase